MVEESAEGKIARFLEQVVSLYDQGRYAQAITPATELCTLVKIISGPKSNDYATSLDALASLYYAMRNYEAAEPLYREARDIRREVLGERHPDYATSLNTLALLYRATGNYEAAEPLCRQALDVRREALGKHDPIYAKSLNNLAGLYLDIGNYQAAEPLLRQAIEIDHEALGERHPDYATSLSGLAALYLAIGNYEAAEPLFRQALDIDREALGERNPGYATDLNNLAELYRATGNYEAAEPLYREARDIRREVLGERHPDYATSLNGLALLYDAVGNYEAAEALYREACNISREALGERHPDYATSLNNRASHYYDTGNYHEAEPLYREACNIYREVLGERHPDYATSLRNLAALYLAIGNYEAAEPLFRQALDIDREALGERNPGYATSLINFAELYRATGNYEAAEPLYRKACDIYREALGERHPDYVTSLNNLAGLYRDIGNYQAAEPLYLKARDIRREVLGERHPDYATSLNNLALNYCSVGNYQAAEPLYREACNIYREVLGERHPYYATSLSGLAILFASTDRTSKAFGLMMRAASIEDHMIAQVFEIGSDSQRMAYLQSIQGSLYRFLSLVSQHCPPSELTARAAMDLVLRRKALSAEALAIQRDAVLSGKYPALRERLEQLRTLTNEVGRTTFAGPGAEKTDAYRRHLNTLNAEMEQLEAELAHQIPEMGLEQHLRSADHYAIVEALPENAALVEFVCFDEFDFTAVPARGESSWTAPRYLAVVLRANAPDRLEMIDLGASGAIDKMVTEFRASITPEGQVRGNGATEAEEVIKGAAPEGIDLRTAIFDPLVPHFKGDTRVIIAPDGELTRLPFEALPTDDGRRLIDAYRISYLSVGRDVLRFAYNTPHEPNASVVVADPDYDLGSVGSSVAGEKKSLLQKLGFSRHRPSTSTTSASHDVPSADELRSTAAARQSRDLARSAISVKPLPYAKEEGRAIGAQLKVTPWLREQALEGRLKATASPHILHVATHGFFLENQQRDALMQSQISRFADLIRSRISTPQATSFADLMLDRIATSGMENPLLRSGLVLAGVNTYFAGGSPPPMAEDGVLTAWDVSGLDLLATDLAVLSACETGLGDVQTGEGVFGLRRAFMLAGVKTLVMSLWAVDDKATKELMVDFYSRVLNGEGRADALRNAQLTIKAKHPEPYYWGAFICQGNPSPLNSIKSSSMA